MSDMLDKAVLLGLGLEKKVKDLIEDIEKAGHDVRGAKAEPQKPEGTLSAAQAAENRLVDEGVHILKEILSTVKSGKDKLDTELSGAAEKVLEKLHLPTTEQLDVIKEMARVSREKVDRLEKIVEDLETKLGK